MRIQQLQYIIKIVETGSMNEAAKQLFITQPSLSNAVKDLENEMGIEIFIRNPKGITLTHDGFLMMLLREDLFWEVEGVVGSLVIAKVWEIFQIRQVDDLLFWQEDWSCWQRYEVAL